MASRPKVMINLNIILDVLQKRDPFYEASAALLAVVEIGRIQGYLAAHSVTMLFYLIQKGKSASEARATITNLLQFLNIGPVDESTIEQAFSLDYHDFEDVVQMISTVQGRLFDYTKHQRLRSGSTECGPTSGLFSNTLKSLLLLQKPQR